MAEITVATWNIFNDPRERDERLALANEQIAQLGPDVIGLQEVDVDPARVPAPEGYELVHLPNRKAAGGIKSLAVLTRLGVIESDSLDIGVRNDKALRVRLDAGDGATFDFVTTHFVFDISPEGSGFRQAQAVALLAWLRDDVAQVVVGDFNAAPSGKTIATMKEALRSCHESANGSEPDRTQPTPLVEVGMNATVDYIFVSRQIEVAAARLAFDRPSSAGLWASDHFGLAATLRIGP